MEMMNHQTIKHLNPTVGAVAGRRAIAQGNSAEFAEALDISNLGLSGGNLGYQLTSLTSLKNFDISGNNLGNQIPYDLPPNLETKFCWMWFQWQPSVFHIVNDFFFKYLNVARNQINGQLSDLFGKLTALSILDVSFNSLTGNLPQSLSSLSSVTDMYLQNNQFTGTIDVLADLPLKNMMVTRGAQALRLHLYLVEGNQMEIKARLQAIPAMVSVDGQSKLRVTTVTRRWVETADVTEVPWSNERPLENKELNAIIGA
ncbi:STRUBBELIG-receptor family 7-like protein isoform X2 [Tanacetum coccineum]